VPWCAELGHGTLEVYEPGPGGVGRKGGGGMKRRIGDRRAKIRFEIVGDLWGSIDTTTSLIIRNLGREGALLESPVPLAPDSVHWVSVLLDGEPQPMRLRVRHRTAAADATEPPYLIGVEFLSVTDATEKFIEQCLASAQSGPAQSV
jgi:hypothetical protein